MSELEAAAACLGQPAHQPSLTSVESEAVQISLLPGTHLSALLPFGF